MVCRWLGVVIDTGNSTRSMNILTKIWPWSTISALTDERDKAEKQCTELRIALYRESDSHKTTQHNHASLAADHEVLKLRHEKALQEASEHLATSRRMAMIMHMRGYDRISVLLLMLICGSAFGQAIQRTLLTTNPPPLLTSIAGPMLTTNGAGIPVLTYNGSGLTNVSGTGGSGNVIVSSNGTAISNPSTNVDFWSTGDIQFGLTNRNGHSDIVGNLSTNITNITASGTITASNFLGITSLIVPLDTSTGQVQYTLSSRYSTVIVKSNATYNLLLSANGTTNTIAGAYVWIDAQPIYSTNWIIRY